MSAELLQSGLVLALVGVAAVYLGLRSFRSVARAAWGRKRSDGGCESGCGCSAGSEAGRSKMQR